LSKVDRSCLLGDMIYSQDATSTSPAAQQSASKGRGS
jgi:hypothetical protein